MGGASLFGWSPQSGSVSAEGKAVRGEAAALLPDSFLRLLLPPVSPMVRNDEVLKKTLVSETAIFVSYSMNTHTHTEGGKNFSRALAMLSLPV